MQFNYYIISENESVSIAFVILDRDYRIDRKDLIRLNMEIIISSRKRINRMGLKLVLNLYRELLLLYVEY